LQPHRLLDLTHGLAGDGAGALCPRAQHVTHVVGPGGQLGASLADGRERWRRMQTAANTVATSQPLDFSNCGTSSR